MSDIGNKEVMAKNIKYYMSRKGVNQKEVCSALHFKETTFSGWVTASTYPRIDKIEKLANYFSVEKADLIEDKTSKKSLSIPILGSIVAGVPIEAITDILGYIPISPEMHKNGKYFALSVKGSSMEPRIHDGDIVIVRQQPCVETGEVAVVMVDSNEATLKQVIKQDGGILLQAYNPSVFPTRFYSNEDIENLPVTILGKAIEARKKL